MRQKRFIMCLASVDGGEATTLLAIPFEGIKYLQCSNDSKWFVYLKDDYKSENVNHITICKDHYTDMDYLDDITIEHLGSFQLAK